MPHPPCFQGRGVLSGTTTPPTPTPPPPLSQPLSSLVSSVCGGAWDEGRGRKEPRRPAPPLGYAEPLKGIPPEKFNHTAIPKGYHCPWQEFISYRDYLGEGRSHTPSLADYRNFNK